MQTRTIDALIGLVIGLALVYGLYVSSDDRVCDPRVTQCE